MGIILDTTNDRVSADEIAADTIRQVQHLVSRWRFIACVQAFDFLIFFGVGALWLQILSKDALGGWWLLHLGVLVLAAAMFHCIFQCCRLYDFTILARGGESAWRALAAGVISFGPLLAPLLTQEHIATEATGPAFGLVVAGLLGMVVLRLGLAWLARTLQQSGLVGRRIYIIADNAASAASLKLLLEHLPENCVVGIWDISGRSGPLETALVGALSFLRINPVDAVVLKLSMSQPDYLIEAARVLRSFPQTILLALNFEGIENIVLQTSIQSSSPFDGFSNTVLVKISNRPLASWCWVKKDVQDRVIAFLLLVAMAPVMLAIMLAIKISDPGPVFFHQKRRGYGGDTFDIIKFRTMRIDSGIPDLATLMLTINNDSRVFPVGRILRKTSLDEIPQLLNVLRGDMWIVGPRPYSPLAQAGGMIYAKGAQEYTARYRIKPGVTSWAQVSGWRGPTNTLEQLTKRVEHDLYYIENWSTFFDIKILLKTLFCVFENKKCVLADAALARISGFTSAIGIVCGSASATRCGSGRECF